MSVNSIYQGFTADGDESDKNLQKDNRGFISRVYPGVIRKYLTWKNPVA